jgi:heme/copper-type cytochrome/quinol oxidase subunit 1
MGTQGMPRRYYDYEPMFQTYHMLSTVGAYILGVGYFHRDHEHHYFELQRQTMRR